MFRSMVSLLIFSLFPGMVFGGNWLLPISTPETNTKQQHQALETVREDLGFQGVVFYSVDEYAAATSPNEAAVPSLHEQAAEPLLVAAYEDLAQVIMEYPQTEAARRAERMLDAAGLKVWRPDGRIIPKDTFVSVVPILR